MLGLETALSVVQETMVDPGLLTWAEVADRMSYAPARIGRVADHGHPLEDGAPANVVLYDPSVRRVVEAAESVSLSRNTPYAGMELPGRVVATFLRGKPDGPRRQARLTPRHPPEPRWGMLGPWIPSEWLLTQAERGNPQTRSSTTRHHGDQAWSDREPRPAADPRLAYFPRAVRRDRGHRSEGDLVFFTDWQGDADERLTGEPGSEVVEVLGRADERGVDVRGLVWRSHLDQTGFFAAENRHLGEQLQRRGAEVLLDMRVRTGGSHHQKFVVIRHRDDPSRDVAFVGGMDLAHNRRDDADHGGDPQPQPLTEEYGEHPPWHDVQVAIRGPGGATTSRPSSGSAGRTRRRCPGTPVRTARRRAGATTTPRRTRCPSSGRRRPRQGPTSSSCCGPTPTCGTAATTRSPGAASGASPAATPRRSPGPSGSSTSRTSTSGATASPSRSRPTLRSHPELRLVVVIPLVPGHRRARTACRSTSAASGPSRR